MRSSKGKHIIEISRRFARKLLRDERGQSTTEYIMILSIIVIVAMKFKTKFAQEILPTLVNKLGEDVTRVGEDNGG